GGEGAWGGGPPPRWADTDERLTMRPTPAAIIPGTTRLVTRNVPRMLMSKTRSHSAVVTSRNAIAELTRARGERRAPPRRRGPAGRRWLARCRVVMPRR